MGTSTGPRSNGKYSSIWVSSSSSSCFVVVVAVVVGSGLISYIVFFFRLFLKGQAPTEDELFHMISEVDENKSGSIDFGEFVKVVESQKKRAESFDDDNDMIDAYVAVGGKPDKSGHVKRETLVQIIKYDFGLTIGE